MAGNSNEDVSGAPAGNMMATTVSSNNLAQSDSNLALGQINSSSRSSSQKNSTDGQDYENNNTNNKSPTLGLAAAGTDMMKNHAAPKLTG